LILLEFIKKLVRFPLDLGFPDLIYLCLKFLAVNKGVIPHNVFTIQSLSIDTSVQMYTFNGAVAIVLFIDRIGIGHSKMFLVGFEVATVLFYLEFLGRGAAKRIRTIFGQHLSPGIEQYILLWMFCIRRNLKEEKAQMIYS
jgi:hypothetical protein